MFQSLASSTSSRSSQQAGEAASTLARNLRALSSGNRELADRLQSNPSATVDFEQAADGLWTGSYQEIRLCSRYQPGKEAMRLVEEVDVVEKPVVVVLGFGMGHHVRQLAERVGRDGLIIIHEPDLGLLRSVLETVDCTAWIRSTNCVFCWDHEDRTHVIETLHSFNPLLVQGVHLLEHPPSRQRLKESSAGFSSLLTDVICTARATMATTLARSADTVANLVGNLPLYAFGPGIADLENACRGALGIVISAGPSLDRNIEQLAADGVHEGAVLISAQTALKPLLAVGVVPHFITALDYHQISRRFYEDLDANLLENTTLVIDPKAHPIIAASYPGPVRTSRSEFLDRVLGEHAPDNMSLPPASNVAQMAYCLARHLGCDPVAMVGQDLSFTDGLYYAGATAIDNVWLPELGMFNTIEMMEWQRIARNREFLSRTTDVRGRAVYTDQQMVAYLHQFERLFAADRASGMRVLDATEGGLRKQGASVMTLEEVLREHLSEESVVVPAADTPGPSIDRDLVLEHLESLRESVIDVRRNADQAVLGIDQCMRMGESRQSASDDPVPDSDAEARGLVDSVNQLGIFRKIRDQRRSRMNRAVGNEESGSEQLVRERSGFQWTGESAAELERLLGHAVSVIRNRHGSLAVPAQACSPDVPEHGSSAATKVEAFIALDPGRDADAGSGWMHQKLADQNVLQLTLQQLGRSTQLTAIVLLATDGIDVDSMIDRDLIGIPIEVIRCGESVFDPRHSSVMASRAFSGTSWRGGIGGTTVYDEVIAPEMMHALMADRDVDAVLVTGPDWPLVIVDGDQGCDAVIRRWRRNPAELPMVFTQAPPGLCGMLITTEVMCTLADRDGDHTIGSLLSYRPDQPQPDPIVHEVNVPVDHRIRDSLIRCTFDTDIRRRWIRRAMEPRLCGYSDESTCMPDPIELINLVQDQSLVSGASGPGHLVIELCTGRRACGMFSPHRNGTIQRQPMTIQRAERLFDQFDPGTGMVVTFAGIGDPMVHPDFDAIIRSARDAGAHAIHLRTELLASREDLDRLLRCGVDVISVDLHADSPKTYRAMMGIDRYHEVVDNIEYLLCRRERRPLIVPRLQRCLATLEEVESFHDRWLKRLGSVCIEGIPTWNDTARDESTGFLHTRLPDRLLVKENMSRMFVHSDGGVPIRESDLHGSDCICSIDDVNLSKAWRVLVDHRRAILRQHGPCPSRLGLLWP